MKIGEKTIRVVSLAVIIAFAGIGVLSVVLNYRDFAFYLATNVMSYKKQIFDLEEEANQRSRFYANQRGQFESLQRTSDSLRRKVESLERKIESHKLSFKREVDIAVYGYKKEITVRRDWERRSTIIKKKKDLAYIDIHDFVDIAQDTNLPASYLKFKHPGSPWYIDKLLDRLDHESLIISGGGADCWGIPQQLTTWTNHYQLVITKVEKIVRCGDAKSGGTKHYEYWIGTASDSSQWIISLKPEAYNMSRLGLGIKYLEGILDSMDLLSYYID